MKELVLIIVILLLPAGLLSQDLSGLRHKTLIAASDTILLDTLRIVPGSVLLMKSGKKIINDNLYTSDAVNSRLILKPGFPYKGEEIDVTYRVFTSEPELGLARKEKSLILPWQREESERESDQRRYAYRPVSDDIWKEETMVRSGSISRGVSFGNNQDVIVNSNLNLQLSGKLDENINITASISDQNIPLQAEGYSQQIYEFDRIFIRLYNDNLSLTAGDFEVTGGGGVFLPLEKKAQGIRFASITEPESGPFKKVSNTANAAISKGRYHRNSFFGVEGNQGPYRLTGANDELFIIVLSGTERVYIDGRLVSRGIDREYVIDYNLAEITFTSNLPVTKDRRIVVEFEYSDRNYSRFLVSNTTSLETLNGNWYINVFSEHDARNHPLMQDLKDEEKQLLSYIGDSLHQARVPAVDSVEFRNDMVLYEKADTTVNGITRTIYRYSVDPEAAHYRLGFSYVGENRGSYKPEASSANGRVFRWIAPVNGIPAGSYEPVTLLVAPKKHQVMSIGGSNSLTDNTTASAELALSNFDRNTFSGKDSEDNRGFALKLGLYSSGEPGSEGEIIRGNLEYEYIGKNFATVERFRPVEFDRDWNLSAVKRDDHDEHKLSLFATYNGKEGDMISYTGEYLNLHGAYSALRNSVEAVAGIAGFESKISVGYLNSGSESLDTDFLSHFAEVSRPVQSIRLGVRSEGENNRIADNSESLLLASSFAFHQWEIFLENADTSAFRFYTAYRERADRLPFENELVLASEASEYSAGFSKTIKKGNRIAGNLHHRKLRTGNMPDQVLQGQASGAGKSINGRLENNIRLLKGIIDGSGYYETGSGLELKKNFMFIEVARGRGTHIWTDYNENGIKELDEFEQALFDDQGNYIRILIPGDEYISVRSNQFNQSLRINAPSAWHKGEGWQRFISFFSARTAYSSGKKTLQEGFPKGINPFLSDISDTNLVNISSMLRNTIAFQPGNSSFTLEYLHQSNISKNLLVSGYDTRQMRSDAINLRLNATKTLILDNQLEKGMRSYSSEFFPGRNHDIGSLSGKLGVSYQPDYSLQTSVFLRWTGKKNRPGAEKSGQYNIGTDLSYTILSKGNINIRADYYFIEFNGSVNTPLAWEMLEGLKPGSNMTMLLQYQQNITGSLQMSLNYSGRKSRGIPFIHTGGIQMIAFF